MESLTNWSTLWTDLVETRARGRQLAEGRDPQADLWADRAQEFDTHVKRRWRDPDSSRAFIRAQLTPDATVLDIGAGTGAWTALFAGQTAHVTALDPSPAMLSILRENVMGQGIINVSVIQGAWPEVDVAPHDFSLCAHAMYGVPDFVTFVRRMVAVTTRMCFLILRAPNLNSILATAARRIWGQPYDSPNFTIAYNILLHMGNYPNVLIETPNLRDLRFSPSLNSALSDVKRHFSLANSTEHDDFLMDLLCQRLTVSDGGYVWPRDEQAALVYWSVNGNG